ncbi:SDR family oxidoreductase [Vibrio sinaloensis]|nr:SDR family oxidoreductase [Vibrio sinaloensis]
MASVKDAASMTLFLLSEEASGITGATFTVDAGSTA